MRDKNLITTPDQVTKLHLCGPIPTVINIPLRIKPELAQYALDDPEFKGAPTEDLLFLAQDRKHVYTVDRASAIAVLKGIVNIGGKVEVGPFTGKTARSPRL